MSKARLVITAIAYTACPKVLDVPCRGEPFRAENGGAAARRRRGGLVVRGRPKVGRRELRCGPSRVPRARGLDSPFPAAPAGGRLHRNREARAMRVDTQGSCKVAEVGLTC